METLVNRFRNITVLLLVIFAQLILLAYQVKNEKDVRIIRFWAVTAVTPLARTIESVRSGIAHFVDNYFWLRGVDEENRRMKTELGRLKLENQFLKTELATADRAKALGAFVSRTPSKMIAARVIGTGAGATSKLFLVDRGSMAGVMKGMAVVTPDGIVGKVLESYPTASQVLQITDPSFAAGVISQKHHVRGILKGMGYATCRVDGVPVEEKVDIGEWFYTSGDDRVFPKGLPAGTVAGIRPSGSFADITVDPSGLQGGLEEVLIVLEGVHQAVQELKAASSAIYLGPAVPAKADAPSPADGASGRVGEGANTTDGATGKRGDGEATPISRLPMTDADRIRERYKEIGAAQGHVFGEGLPGSKPPDFNLKIGPGGTPPPKPRTPGVTGIQAGVAGNQAGAISTSPRLPKSSPPTGGTASHTLPLSPSPTRPVSPPAGKTTRPPKPTTTASPSPEPPQ